MPFQMPRLSQRGFEAYLDGLLPDNLHGTTDLLRAGLKPNPRAIKRFVNVLSLQDLLARNRGVEPYDVAVLAAVLLVRSSAPEFYSRLEKDPSLLLRVAEDLETEQEGITLDWDEEVVRLVRVLARSAKGVPSDVAAYIDLSAAVRPDRGSVMAVSGDFTRSMLQELIDRQPPGAQLALRRVTFAPGEDFREIRLAGADLSMAILAEVGLVGANFKGASLSHADLSRSDLEGANLVGARMVGAKLIDANLRNANLGSAVLTNADLRGAQLSGANLRNAQLYGAKLDGAKVSDSLPDDTAVEQTLAAQDSLRVGSHFSAGDLLSARAKLIRRLLEQSASRLEADHLIDLRLRVDSDLAEGGDLLRFRRNRDEGPKIVSSSTIIDLFSSANQELLVLGGPGSGKSTLAQQLLKQLLNRANEKEAEPVPVLLSLASWQEHISMGEWIAAECSLRFGLPLALARALAENGMLVSALDGFDEIPPDHRAKFIDEATVFVEMFRLSHGTARMVLTSQIEEEGLLASRLGFRRTVQLLPPGRNEVVKYLKRYAAGIDESELLAAYDEWLSAYDKENFTDFGVSPLMLRLVALDLEANGTLRSFEESIAWFADYMLKMLVQRTGYDPMAARNCFRAFSRHLASKQHGVFSGDDPQIRSAFREQGLRGAEVPRFFREAARVGLLAEVRPNTYSFAHGVLQEYFGSTE
jgi:uncharacterized protein YjbI with pentapeptide repeats